MSDVTSVCGDYKEFPHCMACTNNMDSSLCTLKKEYVMNAQCRRMKSHSLWQPSVISVHGVIARHVDGTVRVSKRVACLDYFPRVKSKPAFHGI